MVNVKYTKNSYRPLKGSLVGGPYKTSLGSTLTLTCSPLESKIVSVESQKILARSGKLFSTAWKVVQLGVQTDE